MRNVTLLLLLSLSACIQPPATDGDLAITHVTILPMDTERTLSDQTVVIREGRVVLLGPSASVHLAEGVETVDGRGRFLLPSFADTHIHLCDSGDLVTYLAYGVGAVRNMEGTPFHLHLRDSIRSGLITGPALFTTGPYTNADGYRHSRGARAGRIGGPHADHRPRTA
jgi:imidazolonepropionase-like amidohydrolase